MPGARHDQRLHIRNKYLEPKRISLLREIRFDFWGMCARSRIRDEEVAIQQMKRCAHIYGRAGAKMDDHSVNMIYAMACDASEG